MMMRLGLIVIVWLLTPAVSLASESSLFLWPPQLEADVRFWMRVYTEVDSHGGLIHDDRHLAVVYEIVRFPEELSETERRQRVGQAKQRYREILLGLARGKREGLTEGEREVLARWPQDVSDRELREAAYRVRFQLGQADRFRAGLIRAGAWEAYIRRTLAELELPVELAALPHVESSYNPLAYSHVGAAGLWQLTRSTGRRYLQVDGALDERLDPFAATLAAARLLKHNHVVTGSWPLAITAYNHGAAGMRRAVQTLGTHDITTIVRTYRSRTFGFASRNFYPAFLAAVELHFNAERYFGRLEVDKPVATELVEMPAYMTVTTLERALSVDRTTLQEHNRALQPAVWRDAKYIPRGYPLRVPRDATSEPLQTLLARVVQAERHAAQVRDQFYTVRAGDALSAIAARHDVSVDALLAVNGLPDRHRIRAGQVLRLPPSGPGGRVILAGGEAQAREAPTDGVYQVRPGDTLSIIAARLGVSEQTLVEANGLPDGNRIRAGQRLQLALAPAVAPTPEAVEAQTATLETPVQEQVAKVEAAEPASAAEAANLGPTLPLAVHPELEADPSDYSVASDHTIEVQAAETLGHYAEWLQIRADDLRRLNAMHHGQPVVVGRRLRLDFGQVRPEAFEQRRIAYHRALQEAFFSQYQIGGTHEHVVQRGESIWVLAQRAYGVPLWLLRQYNPDLDPSALRPGTLIAIPRIEPRPPADADSPGASGDTT